MVGLKVLLVEDEGAQALALEQTLRDLGHQVVGLAHDGAQACRLRRQLGPDLVLMDICLPGMDGLEAARLMNQEQPLPVVLVTGQGQDQFLERLARARVHGYLLKPVERQALGPCLELAMRLHQEEQGLSRQVVDLREALAQRKTLAKALGRLMDGLGLAEAPALELLERLARSQGLELARVAQQVLDTPALDLPRLR